MKLKSLTKPELHNSLCNVRDITIDKVDNKKIFNRTLTHVRDIRNYLLLQKYPFFNWPLWLQPTIDATSSEFRSISSIILSNTINRDCINISNQLSRHEISLDPVGMLSPSYCSWSIECWILNSHKLLRPQNRIEKINQSIDLKSSISRTIWKETDFKLTENVYCTLVESDEAIIELNCSMKDIPKVGVLFFLVRPYNLTTLGTINSIEYVDESRTLIIDKKKRIIISNKPKYIITGNGENGDIDIIDLKQKYANPVDCNDRMATIALGFPLKQGENNFIFRVNLSEEKNINPAKLSFPQLKKEFIDFSDSRKNNGINITLNNRNLVNWLYSSKLSTLNLPINLKENLLSDMESLYFIIMSYHRMGYFAESLRIIDSLISDFTLNKKSGFLDIINGCYFINIIADYFIFSRDADYLRARYETIKDVAEQIYNHSSGIKKGKKLIQNVSNSIKYNFMQQTHIHDTILVSFSQKQFAYLSRCLGLFGDEIKYKKESDRLESIIHEYFISKEYIPAGPPLEEDDEQTEKNDPKNTYKIKQNSQSLENDFFVYTIFSCFPYPLQILKDYEIHGLFTKISEHYKGIPLFFNSLGGWPLSLTLIYAINLLAQKDRSVFDILVKILTIGKERFALPEVVCPSTKKGIRGNGDSKSNLALLLILIRNLMFVDYENRLELFPVPHEEWFVVNKDIEVLDAPSRFGKISFRAITTKNEIQIFFDEIPKFIPRDILINLPFKTKIQEGDDFIIKKQISNSYLISGWPSIIKFSRK